MPHSAADDALAAWRLHDPRIDTKEVLVQDLSSGSLPEAFTAGAHAHPDSVLAVGDDALTLAEFVERAERWAGALEAAGVTPGRRVMLQATTSAAMVCAYLGLLRAGATIVLVSPALTATELATIAMQSGARLAITDHETPHGVSRLPLAELAEAAVVARPTSLPGPSSGDVALIAFTSGTTGTPKGVPLTHGMLLASIRAVMRAWRWSAGDRLVHALPLSHQHGLGGIHATLIAGSSARLLSGFDPAALIQEIRAESATVLFGVPTIYQRLVGLPGDNAAALSSLRLATSGSAPLPPALFHRIEEKLGITPLERYGLTESGLDVSNLYTGPRRPGVVGFPLPGVELRLTADNGTDVAFGAEGEIALRGPQVFDGYLDDPQATARAFHPGGWFRTGDLGRITEDGALAITGRLKDIIVTGGMNVSPREVEDVLAAHPDVEEAAVTGLPDERWGEAVAAWVVLRRAVDVATLTAYCRDVLAPFKCPKTITVVDALPRNALGKVQRNLLIGRQ
ncbi:class I adenylate-forming enzyme family protein [Mycobacterium sp. NAZ190054]|uniref:class I adenylate-forming enzyme family protein n=1 Tax=Mycobacterium sp. NAZ190054 TaxID=1747766 RepID=UPI00079B9A90|nr:AMP-binding protein [Mycobacterium sp. NAZ190054]KWX61462.1 hypothetical protein ASJ79_29735 [Mycobacterium sp. NAZ190054]